MPELHDRLNLPEELLLSRIPVNVIHTGNKNIGLEMLRLDKIHPAVSGNKLFKLYHFLNAALTEPRKALLTFGGTYSNHLSATAYATKLLGIRSVGIVPGSDDIPDTLTMQFCKQHGMELQVISRREYRELAEDSKAAEQKFPGMLIIPHGGFSPWGAHGAAMIASKIPMGHYTHIALAVGTATTLAGILNSNEEPTEVLAFPALKGMKDISQRLSALKVVPTAKLKVFSDYHFGGFSKINSDLIDFMNQFYRLHHIPLDRVYTAKMMFGIMDLVQKDYFPSGARILCIHSGGLQGNASLPAGTLDYF